MTFQGYFIIVYLRLLQNLIEKKSTFFYAYCIITFLRTRKRIVLLILELSKN